MSISVGTMKWIDRHVGVPACWVLSLWRRLTRVGRPRPPAATPLNSVLYVELSEMGSMVAAYPVLARFHQRHPDLTPYFLTFKQNRACLDVLHLVPPENIIVIDSSRLTVFVKSLLGALRRIRRLRLDATVDFELFSRISAIFCALAGARLAVGYDRLSLEGLYRGHLQTHPVGYNPYVHISRNFQALVHALEGGLREHGHLKEYLPEPTLLPLRPPLAEAHRAALWDQLRRRCPTLTAASRLVIVNPNAGPLLPIRAWPLERYIELTRRLLGDPDVYVLILGTHEAAADAARMTAEIQSPRLIDFTRQTQFADLIPLFSLADMLITNDSGPAHFAALADVSIVVFFGPETPELYRPLSPRAHCFFTPLHCAPCLSAFNHRTTTCTQSRCLLAITVDHVFPVVQAHLKQYPAPTRP